MKGPRDIHIQHHSLELDSDSLAKQRPTSRNDHMKVQIQDNSSLLIDSPNQKSADAQPSRLQRKSLVKAPDEVDNYLTAKLPGRGTKPIVLSGSKTKKMIIETQLVGNKTPLSSSRELNSLNLHNPFTTRTTNIHAAENTAPLEQTPGLHRQKPRLSQVSPGSASVSPINFKRSKTEKTISSMNPYLVFLLSLAPCRKKSAVRNIRALEIAKSKVLPKLDILYYLELGEQLHRLKQVLLSKEQRAIFDALPSFNENPISLQNVYNSDLDEDQPKHTNEHFKVTEEVLKESVSKIYKEPSEVNTKLIKMIQSLKLTDLPESSS